MPLSSSPLQNKMNRLSEAEFCTLINDACWLDSTIKDYTKRLEGKKIIINGMLSDGLIVVGKYVTKEGGVLLISESDVYSDPDPQQVFEHIMNNGLAEHFKVLFKVGITKLREVLGEKLADTFRKKLDKKIVKLSFK